MADQVISDEKITMTVNPRPTDRRIASIVSRIMAIAAHLSYSVSGSNSNPLGDQIGIPAKIAANHQREDAKAPVEVSGASSTVLLVRYTES